MRCILETPATSQRRGFSDAETLLTALCAELIGLQNQMTTPAQAVENSIFPE